MAVSKDELYSVVLHGSTEEKQNLLTEFKTHVKKDNVELAAVPKYFEALAIAVDTTDPAVQALAFSLICHLVKRVSIQNSKGTILQQQSFLVLPIILPKIADAKSSTKLSAKRALEAYWLSAPSNVEAALVEIGLNHRSSLMVNECVVWLNHVLTAINPHFKLDSFLDPLAKVLAKHPADEKLMANVKTLFDNYYESKHNRLHRFEFQRALENNNVPSALRASFMGTDTVLHAAPRPLSSARVGPQSTPPLAQPTEETSEQPVHVPPEAPPADIDDKVEQLLNTLPGYPMDTTVKPIHVTSPEHLSSMVADMYPHFENKESERNWNLREKNILKLRALLRGNVVSEYLPEFVQAIKGLTDGICKSLSSLRTTLTVNSSQFVKEMAVILNAEFEPLAELFTPTLIKLCSNTKHLTNTNAHVAMSTIIATCFLTPRLVQKIPTAAFEKNVNPRSFSAFWLRIYIIRSSATWGTTGPEMVDRILHKLLPDPNSLVRTAAKEAYWTYLEYSAPNATDLLLRLDSNTVKALERSRPNESERFKTVPSLAVRKSRPLLKESIFARNKELMSKQNLSRSNSRLSSKTPPKSAADMRKQNTTFFKGQQDLAHHIKPEHEPAKPKVPAEHTPATSSIQTNEAPRSNLERNVHPAQHDTHRIDTAMSIPHVDNVVKNFSPQVKSEPQLGPKPSTLDQNFRSSSSIRPISARDSPSMPALESPGPMHSEAPSFDRNDDPIIKFLLSSQEDLLKEGINLMKYALMGGEELSQEFGIALRKVSILHPLLMRPLFEGSENLIRGLKKIMPVEDMVRVYCLFMKDSDASMSSFLSVFTVDEFYLSVDSLLSYIVDLDNIMDDRNLVMQIIRYKAKLLESMMVLLNFATSKLPISDINYTRVVSIMFDLVPVVYSTQLISTYRELLQKLYAINTTLFLSQLSSVPKSNKQEIKHLVGVDNILEYKNTDATLYNFSELTKVAPGSSLEKLSPLKQPTEFSMVIPRETTTASNDRALAPSSAESSFSAEAEGMSMSHTPPEHNKLIPAEDIVMEDAEKSPQPVKVTTKDVKIASPRPTAMSPNIFKRVGDKLPKELFPKLNSDSSNGLADELAHVKLTTQANSIESFIEKVDPLNKLSNRNKTISIFEDSMVRSPQKVREYSYTDLNWFNFSVAKIALEQDSHVSKNYKREEFWMLCDNLESGQMDRVKFASLIFRLQAPRSHVFRRYLIEDGHSRLEQSLFTYLASPESDTMNGLLVLKQLLINRHQVSREKLWDALMRLSENVDDDSIGSAIGEVFDEAVRGIFTTGEILVVVLEAFESESLTDQGLLFALTSLQKVLSGDGLEVSINSEIIALVDETVRRYLGHPKAEIRKAVFESYGRLLSAARTSEMTTQTGEGGSCIEAMSGILASVTKPQEKMIQFFSA